MSKKTISVMTAIEDEVRHNRREWSRHVKLDGQASTQLAWEVNKENVVLPTLHRMVNNQPTSITEWITALGALAFDLELQAPGGVTYEEQ